MQITYIIKKMPIPFTPGSKRVLFFPEMQERRIHLYDYDLHVHIGQL